MNAPLSGPPAATTVADYVAAVVRPEIRALTAYAVSPPENLIKLDANESPFPLPAPLRAKLAAAVADVPVHRYPDGGASEVINALQRRLTPIARTIGTAHGVPALKAALDLLGYAGGPPRPPLGRAPAQVVDTLRTQLAALDALPLGHGGAEAPPSVRR